MIAIFTKMLNATRCPSRTRGEHFPSAEATMGSHSHESALSTAPGACAVAAAIGYSMFSPGRAPRLTLLEVLELVGARKVWAGAK
jgi:hypothetical protein